MAMASPDGKRLYYSTAGLALWKVPVDGGEEMPVLDGRSLYSNFAFCVTASGIYFAGLRDPASRTVPLKVYRFADGQMVELGHFDKPLGLNISVSSNGKWLVYAQLDSSVDDLMLVDNFQ